MKLLSRLFGRSGQRRPRSRREQICLVDASGMVDARQRPGGVVSPREHFAILRMLARFAEREGVEIQAFFTGRPLREAGHNTLFKGVRVLYAENVQQTEAGINQLASSLVARRSVIVFTANEDLEQSVRRLGAASMRLTTLRKSLDERADAGERPERGPRERRGRGGRNTASSAKPAPPAEPKPQPPAATANGEKRTVLDLIDPV